MLLMNLFYLSDGLKDCQDPECCYSEKCAGSQYCHSSFPDPKSIIESANETHPFDSYFNRYSFFIKNIQGNSRIESFNRRYKNLL